MKTGRAWDYWAVFFMRCFAFCSPNELTLILGLRGWQFRFVTFVSCLLFEKSIKWKCMSQKIEYYRRYRLIISFSTGLKKKCFDQTRSKCAKLWRNRSCFFKIYLILLANYRFFHVLIQKKRQGRPPPPPTPPPNVRLTFLVEQIDMCDFPYHGDAMETACIRKHFKTI